MGAVLHGHRVLTIGLFIAAVGAPLVRASVTCRNTVTARVVAIEQVHHYNRFGAVNPYGLIYALEDDVEAISGTTPGPGNAVLKTHKRPRPLVLRVNEGDCLQVSFRNWLSPQRPTNADVHVPRHSLPPPNADTTRVPLRDDESGHLLTRHASMHVNGLDYATVQTSAPAGCTPKGSLPSDGAFVGNNESSLVPPGECAVYTWYAKEEGGYLLYSMGASAGGEGDGGQLDLGLFGAINVEPAGSRWYRSQVTHDVLNGAAATTAGGRPNYARLDYGRLSILDGSGEIRHSDLNAIVFQAPSGEQDCDEQSPHGTCGQSFREFTVIFHDEIRAHQAFAELANPENPVHAVRDNMAINYGSSSMGAILLANAKKIGPAKDCVECKYEEFFLTSWANGDPALLPQYRDDPSNVHHSYLGDPVRFRNLHAGPKETHVFHLHAHQWLQEHRDQNSSYLDSQTISPGASYTYQIHYGGGGNRNFTVGDAIFHCHLYPHFAQGMWELWRVHDVFEDGTPGLFDAATNPRGRNLPDHEIVGGTPNPAVVPIPGFAMPPRPTAEFRGYPFYVAGQAGHRPPQPPLDMEQKDGQELNGGLRRHRITGGTAETGAQLDQDELFEVGGEIPEFIAKRVASRVQEEPRKSALTMFAKKLVKANVEFLEQGGTDAEQVAMSFHAGTATLGGDAWWGVSPSVRSRVNRYEWPVREYRTVRAAMPPGVRAPRGHTFFAVNGRPPDAGAPFANPCPTRYSIDGRRFPVPERNYRAAYVQFDMTVNKWGWHDPQARIIVLENDIRETLDRTRPAEPLFFRASSGDCISFKATNLTPSALNLDDFQIFTPTDTIGQHIHLVKFDVTSSDGSGNGWNYEDGTFAADEVRERIEAINAGGAAEELHPVTHPMFLAGGAMEGDSRGLCADQGGSDDNEWCGAQTTVQRWWADPVINRARRDRTLRSVFTHDHFGPSSHQHHGLYGALLAEPLRSKWETLGGDPLGGSNADGTPIVLRQDGGPTAYAANVLARTHRRRDTRREYNLAFADFAIVYTRDLDPVNAPGQADRPRLDDDRDDEERDPEPEAISTEDPGTFLINYRHEPLGLRVGRRHDGRNRYEQKPCPNLQDPDCEGDMANVFSSIVHADADERLLRHQSLRPSGDEELDRLRHILEDRRVRFNFQLYQEPWRKPGDPATPLLAAYDGDPLQIRLIQGSQEEQHIFNMHGVRWLFQPSSRNSGFTNAQEIGISEHLEFEVPLSVTNVPVTDYLYSSPAVDDRWNGIWGMLRVFGWNEIGDRRIVNHQRGLRQFPRDAVKPPPDPADADPTNQCPREAPTMTVHVGAWLASDLLGRPLTYNERFRIADPTAIVYVEHNPRFNVSDMYPGREEVLADLRHTYGPGGKPLEPLILRVKAGSCIQVALHNYLPAGVNDTPSYNFLPPILNGLNFNQLRMSGYVSLHAQLTAQAVSTNDGSRVGFNEPSTVRPITPDLPPDTQRMIWYAGTRELVDCAVENCSVLRRRHCKFPRTRTPGARELVSCPVEFGAIALSDIADVVKHSSHGAAGMLIVEPEGTCASYPADPARPDGTPNGTLSGEEMAAFVSAGYCAGDATALQAQFLRSRVTADIRPEGDSRILFRDFAVLYQDDLSLQRNGQAIPNIGDADDSEDTGQKAFTYRTEPLWARVGLATPANSPEEMRDLELSPILSSRAANSGCGGACGDPATPLFTAPAGREVRFRVVHPGGHARQHGFTLFGHNWDAVPWTRNSTVIGSNDATAKLGSYSGIGPMRHLNIRTCAGGENALPGDYLYRTQDSFNFQGGLWGIFRVTPRPDSVQALPCAAADPFRP